MATEYVGSQGNKSPVLREEIGTLKGPQGAPGGVLLLGTGVQVPPTNPVPAAGTIIAYRA
jgi:hypothetical protein